MKGQRIEKTNNGLANPGDYWKDPSDDTWHCCSPNGLYGWLRNHHVVEHDDKTITVAPGGGGSSNSILISNGTGNKKWHGYIDRGVWKECA